MTVVLLVEGDTETALKAKLKQFLDDHARAPNKPKVRFQSKDLLHGLNATRLKRRVQLELGNPEVTAVVALIDVYPEFSNADEAKRFMRLAVGDEPRFFTHAAQFDVEAWLLPYWDAICQRIGVRQALPGAHPEQVNDQNPPSKRLKELYRRAKPRPREYHKPSEMSVILRDQDLTIAAGQCPELKSFLNTLLALNDLEPL
jgi:hypothetical protein